jgi:hypothetical protein
LAPSCPWATRLDILFHAVQPSAHWMSPYSAFCKFSSMWKSLWTSEMAPYPVPPNLLRLPLGAPESPSSLYSSSPISLYAVNCHCSMTLISVAPVSIVASLPPTHSLHCLQPAWAASQRPAWLASLAPPLRLSRPHPRPPGPASDPLWIQRAAARLQAPGAQDRHRPSAPVEASSPQPKQRNPPAQGMGVGCPTRYVPPCRSPCEHPPPASCSLAPSGMAPAQETSPLLSFRGFPSHLCPLHPCLHSEATVTISL